MVTVISYLDQRRENKIQINFVRNCIIGKKEKQKKKKSPNPKAVTIKWPPFGVFFFSPTLLTAVVTTI